MTQQQQWDKLAEVFDSARELSPQERESLLAAQQLDPQMRREVDELLAAHDAIEAIGEHSFPGTLDTARASALLDTVSADDSPMEMLSPGELVGRYRIERAIGQGGMGVIYLATDPRLNRSVAIKMLPAHLSVDSSARQRFEEEARAASLLDHAHVATVYEVSETAEGRLFIAMAYYEGDTLREMIKRGTFPVSDVVAITTQVAEGLAAAHAAGLVHRDIKPGNIIVTRQGVAKIVDFGIARIATDEMSNQGATAGTIAYMSPEQADGAPPHPGMDVWSFGVMLYEALTGVRPFRGDRDELVMRAIRNDDPERIDQFRGKAIPAGLIGIVQRCLQKIPADRYPDASGIVTDLRSFAHSSLEAGSAGQLAQSGQMQRATSHPVSRRRRYAVAALAIIATLGAAWGWVRSNQLQSRQTAAAMHSIAVLPFDNQLNPSDGDHFSAGLADELITALGGIPGLKVAARTSTFALYSSGIDARAIADRLGVATLLEGSVRRDATRLRISARLVQASDQAVLWSEAYDVPVRDVFAVQEQIARSIAEALNVRLASTTGDSSLTRRPTADMEAYYLYLRGRHVRTRDTRDRLEQALAYYRGAIERDPNFANAYSGVAETYVNLANFGYVTPTEAFGNAEIASARALELNPRLSDAYTSHAYVLASRREFAAAETGFRRALELNPNNPLGRHYYSLLLAMLDRTDEALDQNRRARELDPLFTPAVADYGIILSQRGELAAAGRELSSALALEPKFALTLFWLGAMRAAEGSISEATQLLEQSARAAPDYPGVLGDLAYTYAHAGRRHAADSIVSKLRLRATSERGRANLAFAYAALGNRDEAFELMRQLDWDVASVIGLRADPLLRPLRSDPRYAALAATIVRSTPPKNVEVQH